MITLSMNPIRPWITSDECEIDRRLAGLVLSLATGQPVHQGNAAELAQLLRDRADARERELNAR